MPSVCVLVPVFNDQNGITKTLAALADDPDAFDVVIVDDGSREPVRASGRCGDHPITLLRLEPNRGIEHALNAGLDAVLRAGFRYVARLDAGDIAIRGRFAAQAAFLDANPNVGIVGSWAECVDDDGNYLFTMRLPTEHGAILRKQRYVPGLLHPAVMMRASVLNEVGHYSDRYKAAEDFDLFARIGRKHRLANLGEVFTTYVVSAKGTTTTKRGRTLLSRLRIQLREFSWRDGHSYLGVARTLVFMAVPFGVLTTVKRRLWR